MQKILKYGIAYYKKECKVVLKNENRPSRGGFRFLRLFIVLIDMKKLGG